MADEQQWQLEGIPRVHMSLEPTLAQGQPHTLPGAIAASQSVPPVAGVADDASPAEVRRTSTAHSFHQLLLS